MKRAYKTRAQLLGELTVLEGEHRRAQERIRERDYLYRLLVENSLGLMCSHDLDGVLLSINPAAASSLGYMPEDGIGRNLREFIAPSVRHQFDDYLARLRENASDSGLLRLVAKDGGERVWVYHNMRYDEPGLPPRVLGHAQDITERIAMEQALKESKEALERAQQDLAVRVAERTAELKRGHERLRASEARFRALSEHTSDLISIVGPDGRLRYVSPSHRRILGYTERQFTGLDMFELVHPDDRERTRAVYMAGLARRGVFAPPPLELRVRHADGTWLTLEAIANNRLHDPAVGGVIINARDITRRKQAEQERAESLRKEQEARAQAEAAVRVRDDFLIAAAHDLRSPLTVINGHIGLVRLSLESRREISAEWLLHQMRAVTRAASHMLATVEGITDAAQLQIGQAPSLHMESVEMDELVREVVAAIESSGVRGAGSVRLATAGHTVIWGDRMRLERVLHNIIGNAIKYSPHNTPVYVELRDDERWAVITVRDSGVGIPEAELPHIFTQFYRASTASGIPGMGIGLAGASAIIEQHGGRIEIESAEGQGTTVVVSLPPRRVL